MIVRIYRLKWSIVRENSHLRSRRQFESRSPCQFR